MAVFAITFRLGDHGAAKSTYETRWKSIQERIKGLAGPAWWDQTTSFYLIMYSGDANALASAIWQRSELNYATDLMVVINTADTTDSAVIGKYTDSTLDVLLGAKPTDATKS